MAFALMALAGLMGSVDGHSHDIFALPRRLVHPRRDFLPRFSFFTFDFSNLVLSALDGPAFRYHGFDSTITITT